LPLYGGIGMRVILAYDVAEERVSKVLKVARKYLVWVQNSLLEGDITPQKLDMLKMELKRVSTSEDKIRFYILKDPRFLMVEDLYRGKVDYRDEGIV